MLQHDIILFRTATEKKFKLSYQQSEAQDIISQTEHPHQNKLEWLKRVRRDEKSQTTHDEPVWWDQMAEWAAGQGRSTQDPGEALKAKNSCSLEKADKQLLLL